MNRKKITPSHLLRGRGFTRIMPPFILVIFYLFGSILAASTTYAAGNPGGNVSDPVVKAVDIAKPAMVRIMTTLGGHLTVDFPTNAGGTLPVRFPLTGGAYKLQLLGSGAFISAHGDILTADHVVNPPHDAETNQALYAEAAQDVANYFNSHSTSFLTANDIFNALADGSLKSQSQYDQASSVAYLSTDFTGAINVTTLDGMPSGSHASVEKILQENDFQNGDTAIVHVNMDDTPSIKLGDSSAVAQLDPLTIVGFPGNADLGQTTINPSTGFFTASVNRVYVSALKKNGTNAPPLIQVGGNVEQGDSGGPALDSNGNIVGIVSFFINSNGAPEGTSFLQASSIAQQMLNTLQLDITPGAFQTAWNKAFTDYSSTQAGHWHTAEQDLQKLQSNYPNFQAIQPFLDYATTQASKESPITTSTSITLLIIALVVLVVIFLLVLFLFLARRKKNRQAATATQPALYQQPSYNNTGAWPESPEPANSGGMAEINLKDDTGPIPDGQLAQPRPVHSAPQVAQTPAASYNAAQSGSLPIAPNQPSTSSWPAQTPAASYNAAQSGSLPVAPNQLPMSPWPQSYGTPAYGQPAPYGQRPYNPGQPAGSAQGGAYPPYPGQPRQYAPYPQAPATPWPPVSGNTPYAGQQDATTQRRQPSGTAYDAQSPQGYGVWPTPAQPQPSPVQPQQVPAHLIPDVSATFEESTVRVNQRSTSTAEEISGPVEGKKNTPSAMPELAKDQTEIRQND